MIHLLPIGRVSRSEIERLTASLKKIFAVSIVVHDPAGLPASSYDPERRQYSSEQILKSLARFKSSLTQVERVLGIVAVDLFAADLNLVFGEADPKEGVAVISPDRFRPEFYGLAPDKTLFQDRMLKEAVHELGHTYGLGHCPNPACVMHFSNSLQDTDNKAASFCPACSSFPT
jgi:archaemetzincin